MTEFDRLEAQYNQLRDRERAAIEGPLREKIATLERELAEARAKINRFECSDPDCGQVLANALRAKIAARDALIARLRACLSKLNVAVERVFCLATPTSEPGVEDAEVVGYWHDNVGAMHAMIGISRGEVGHVLAATPDSAAAEVEALRKVGEGREVSDGDYDYPHAIVA